LQTVATLGFTPTFVSDDGRSIDGFIALSRLHELIDSDDVLSVIPYRPELLTNSVGSVSNAAEVALRGETFRNFLGFDGTGITIGVISNGVGGVAESQATGDIPPDVGTPGAAATFDSLDDGTGNEGTAMLELIHDIAPGSNLIFHGSGASEAAFAAAIDDLVAAGVDIIVDDINGLATESWFADGVAATAISNAIDAGVFYVSSAGNRGDNGFEADANFVTNQNVFGNVGTFHDFDGNGTFTQLVTITEDAIGFGRDFQIQFDQLFGSVSSDVRLWLFNSVGNVIASSNQNNIATNDPNDILNLSGTGVARLAIELVAGPAPSRLRWIHWGNVGAIEHVSVPGNLRAARDPGHAATVGNVSVGSTNVEQPLVRRDYSGIGEVTRTLDATGTPLPATEFRGGPTLMGVDGTATSVDEFDAMGVEVAGWDDFTTFFGTSAAAPNVAAIAALLLQANPDLTPAELRNLLTGSARDIDAAGVDLTSGFGVVDALGAIGLAMDNQSLVGLADHEFVVVNDTTDLVDANAGDGVVAAAGGQATLRAAVMEANANSDLRVILLPDGLYDLDITGHSTTSAAQGDLDITGNITIIGTGAGASVIDASGHSDRIFDLQNGSSLTLDGLTLTGGLAPDNGAQNGGAIIARNGSTLRVERSAIVDNGTLNGNGGAIYLEPTASAFVRNSVITGNEALKPTTPAIGYGGGIFVHDTTAAPGLVVIENTIVAGNTAESSGDVDLLIVGDREVISGGNNRIIAADVNFVAHTTDTVNQGSYDFLVTDVLDREVAGDNSYAISLREAARAATASGLSGVQEIWIPGWHFRLDRFDEMTTSGVGLGDMEIMHNDVTLVGIAPGETRLDAANLRDRHFQVLTGQTLRIEGMTLSGGRPTFGAVSGFLPASGGGVYVDDGALELDRVALVNNEANYGGALRVDSGSTADIVRSVITNNHATQLGGGIRAEGTGAVTLTDTIVALNTAGTAATINDLSGITSGTTFVSNGGNMFTATQSLASDSSDWLPTSTGYQVPTRIVTGMADTFHRFDDHEVLSVREAVDLANNTTIAEQIWLPSWNYVLNRVSMAGGVVADLPGIDIGDIDVTRSMVIRGGAATNFGAAFSWRSDASTDKVFELLGDYNGDRLVDGADYTIWQDTEGDFGQALAADGNEDGTVDVDDYDIWRAAFGDELEFFHVAGV
jgi:subtilisin family serine protease